MDAGGFMTTGAANTFIGDFAGHENNGAGNTFIGRESGFQNAGDMNTFLGYHSGPSSINGSNNTLLGSSADTAGNLTNATAIGFRAMVTQNNSLVLGSINGVNEASANTDVGIGTTAPSYKLQIIDQTNRGLRVQNQTTGGTVGSFGSKGVFQVDSGGIPGGRLNIAENGNVGVGTNDPKAKLDIAGGSIYVRNPNTLIITSPNGACWGITVNNSGALATFPTTCP
jgi:hypothetical protein